MAIEFVDAVPPRSTGAQNVSEHVKIAETLKTKPGKWARVLKGVKHASVASTINTGKNAYAPKGAFEATSRQIAKDKIDICARYIGQ